MAEEKTPKEIKISIPVPDDLLSLLMPGAAAGHLIKARREVLLALRAVIDSRLEALEKRDGGKPEAKKKIRVE